MCAKLHQVVSGFIPAGPIKEALKSQYFALYYNKKHFAENGFYVYYKNRLFIYTFDEGVTFSSRENMADELKRSLKGYLADYSLRAGDIVVDCGAYIGEFTLYASKAVGPTGKVIAFEPDPENMKDLTANIELNSLTNVTVINKGLWAHDGAMQFIGDPVKGYSFIAADNAAGAINVPVASLDNELERLGVRSVNFIKADIEGSELEFIKGAEKTLKNNNAIISIASYHFIDGKKSCFEIEKMLSALGYKTHTGHPQHLTTYGSKR